MSSFFRQYTKQVSLNLCQVIVMKNSHQRRRLVRERFVLRSKLQKGQGDLTQIQENEEVATTQEFILTGAGQSA